LNGNFEAFSVCFHVPSFVETFEGKRYLRTENDVKTVFDAVREYYRTQAVTNVVRECISAEFHNPETIHNSHITRLLRDGEELFRRPFPVYSILRKFGDNWKVTYSQYAIDDAPKHTKALSG